MLLLCVFPKGKRFDVHGVREKGKIDNRVVVGISTPFAFVNFEAIFEHLRADLVALNNLKCTGACPKMVFHARRHLQQCEKSEKQMKNCDSRSKSRNR